MSRTTEIVVTGLGCLCAAGPDLPSTLSAIFRGERAPRPPTLFAGSYPAPFPVFEVPLATKTDGAFSRTAQLALTAAGEALTDSGWEPGALTGLRVGVCVGTTVGSAMNNEAFYQEFRAGNEPAMAAIERFLRSNPAEVIARHYGFSGPCQTVVNACSSGTDAIGLGAEWLRNGCCDVVLAGGADELCRVTYNGFASLMITDDFPVRPFDRRRKGLNLGEGAAFMLLEPADGIKAGCRRRALVAGYGSACDAYHLTAPHPEGRGLRQALAMAMKLSGAATETLAFVNAHGTGTPDNDRVESRVLADVLPGVPFLSTKGYTGHTLGAAGAIEAVLTVACLERQEIPASAGWEEADPELPVRPVARATATAGQFALSQSLAFGGNNAVIVFRGLPS
ncbi:MAG: beta-ketoacyl-[acyl-carrier-protein] synthase family protein [Desulfuromonadales bacterium]